MSDAAIRLDDFSDRLNPIVVKEVRQGLRTRTFVATFALLLGACLVISLVAFGMAVDHVGPSDLGQGVFSAYLFSFLVVGLFVQPLNAYRAFARERSGEAWAPLVMTGLRPRKILRGKITSHLVQGALYASAIAPFLLFSYLLGGVALLDILTVLVFAMVGQVLVTTLAVSAATFADTRLARGLVQAGMVGSVWALITTGFGAVYGPLLSGSSPRSATLVVALLTLLVLSLAFLFFEIAAARLMTSAENHAKGPRLAALLHSTIVLGLAFWTDEDDFVIAACAWVGVLAALFVLFGATSPVERASVERAKDTSVFLRPGRASSLRWGLLLAFLSGVVLVSADAAGISLSTREVGTVIAFIAWTFLWTCGGVLLHLGPLGSAGVDLVTLRIGIVVAGILALVIGGTADDLPISALLNPFAADGDSIGGPILVLAAAAVAIVTERALSAKEAAARA